MPEFVQTDYCIVFFVRGEKEVQTLFVHSLITRTRSNVSVQDPGYKIPMAKNKRLPLETFAFVSTIF